MEPIATRATGLTAGSWWGRMPVLVGMVAITLGPADPLFAQVDDEEDGATKREQLEKTIASALGTKQRLPRLSVLAGVSLRGASKEVVEAVRTIRYQRIDVDFERATLEDVFAVLKAQTGLQFTTTHRAGKALAGEKRRIRLVLKKLPVENVLNLLALNLGDYHFRLRYGVVVLARRDELRPKGKLRMYAVHDLVRPQRHFPAPRLGLSGLEEE